MADGTLEYAVKLSNGGFLGPLGRATAGLGKFIVKAGAVAVPLAAAAAGASALSIAIKSVNKAAEFETLQVGIKNLLGSKAAADDLLDVLQKFEASTPFTLIDEIAPVAKSLLNAKVAAGDMLAEITALGNVAAASGSSLERLAGIYSKALVKGKVDGEILAQFQDAGVKINSMIADTMDTTDDKIADLASNGAISAGVLRQAFQDLAGSTGAWGKMMADQSMTTNGLISTVKGNVDQLMVAFGQPINDAIKPILKEAIRLIQEMKPMAAEMGQRIGSGIAFGFEALKQGKIGAIVADSLKLAGMQFANTLAGAVNGIFQNLPTFGSEMGGILEGSALIFESSLMRTAGAFALKLGTSLNNAIARVFDEIPGMEKTASALKSGTGRGGGVAGKAVIPKDPLAEKGKSMIEQALDRVKNGLIGGKAFSRGEIMEAQKTLSESINGINEALANQTTAVDAAAEGAKHTEQTQKELRDAVDKSKNATLQQAAETVKGTEAEKRRIKLYNLEESKVRREARRSAADKAPSALDTFFRGTPNNNGMPLTDISQSDLLKRHLGPSTLGIGAKAATAAVRATVNPNARALGSSRKESARDTSGTSMIQVLQAIAKNTEPLLTLASA